MIIYNLVTTGSLPTVVVNDLGGLVFQHPSTTNLLNLAPLGEVQQSLASGDLKNIVELGLAVIQDSQGSPIVPGEYTNPVTGDQVAINETGTAPSNLNTAQNWLAYIQSLIDSGISGGGSSANFSDNEIVSGVIDGANKDFTTTNNFISNSLKVYLDGQRMYLGSIPNDYTITGSNSFRMNFAPPSGAKIIVDYRY